MAISDKLNYLIETKSQLKDMINYGLPTENQITNETTFRNYVKGIFEAFIESLRDSTTLYTNLPKISGNGTQITLNDTANAPMRITLKASELSQDATPTPDTPQDIHTISGDNSVVVNEKNLFDKDNANVISAYFRDTALNQLVINSSNSNKTIIYKGEPNTTYTISKTLGNRFRVGLYNSMLSANGTYTFSASAIRDDTATSITITTTSANYYIYVQIFETGNLQNTLDTIMIEKGSTATEYEEYKEQTTQLNLGVENLFDESKISSVANGTNNNGIITSTENTTSGTKNLIVYYQNSTISVKSGQTLYFSADIKLDNNSTGTLNNINDGENATTTKIVQPTLSHEYQRYQTSFTYNADTTLNKILLQLTSLVGTFTAKNIQISLDKSVAYTPYGTTPIEYCKIGNYEDEFILTSGKNIFSTDFKASDDFTTYTQINSNSFSFTCSGTWKQALYIIPCEKNTDYFLSYDETTNLSGNHTYCGIRGGQTNENLMNLYHGYFTSFNSGENTSLRIAISTGNNSSITSGTISNIQLEKGTSASNFEPYGTNQWYLKKNIGKVVLDGTEGGWQVIAFSNTNDFKEAYTTAFDNDILWNTRDGFVDRFSNYNDVIIPTSNITSECFSLGSDRITSTGRVRFAISSNVVSTTAQWKTWLSNNNTTVYYVLSTPTYTPLNDTLQEQLNNIYEKLLSYKGTTNISQVNNDLPFVLGVSAIEDLE